MKKNLKILGKLGFLRPRLVTEQALPYTIVGLEFSGDVMEMYNGLTDACVGGESTQHATFGNRREIMFMGTRVISQKMEEAYRHRHHDFGGKTEEETACVMGVTPDAVRILLWKLHKVAPQLFPILTLLQARAWHLWFYERMPHNMIAGTMGVSTNAVKKLVGRAKRKFDYHEVLSRRLSVMDPSKLVSFEIGNKIVNVF